MNETLGQVKDSIYNAVKNFHIASMGDDRREIESAESEYAGMISIYGKEMVQLVVDYYNENVIGRAQCKSKRGHQCVLTIKRLRFCRRCVSYTIKKYSDFAKFKFFQILAV